MRCVLLGLLLAWGTAAAENDLLKVGKTPAEKLDEKVQAAKDNVDKALGKIKAKNQALTQALHGFAEPAPPPSAPIPDPTAPDETFRQTFRALLRGHSGKSDAQLPPLPGIRLAALVLKPERPPAALLRIDQETVLVKDNEEISLIRQGQTIQIRIQEIAADGVRLLVLPHNELLTLH